MLWPTLAGSLGWMAWMLALSVQNGRATAESILPIAALSPILGFGVAALTGLPGFMLHRLLFGASPTWVLEEGEAVRLETKANHIVGDEGRGGRLVLTDRRLVFIPHRFNVQLALFDRPFEELDRVGWSRVINAAGMPLAEVVVVEAVGRREVFVLREAQAMAEGLHEHLSAEPRQPTPPPPNEQPIKWAFIPTILIRSAG